MTTRTCLRFLGVAIAAWAAGGCAFLDPAGWMAPKKPGEGDAQTAVAEPVMSAPAFRLAGPEESAAGPVVWTAQTGTVGTVASVQGDRGIQLRGYGLLIGLEGPGSSKMSKSMSEYLQKEISRLQRAELGPATDASPLQLIQDPHSVPVIVRGEIPPAAVKGTRFDVMVQVLDRDVRSLAGGVLLPCSLRLVVNPDAPLEGRVLARAAGRVFTNPFARGEGNPGDTAPGQGRILGGGWSIENRRISLILATPGYGMVQQISQLLNNRFGSQPKTADAVSPTTITLAVPRAYAGREMQFVTLALHMPLTGSTEETEARAKALTDELARPGAPAEEIALCLEAIGKPAIAMVRRHYAHHQRATSFYAARTGARLGDPLSVEVLRRHAMERNGLYRQAAIQELGDTKAYPAAVSTTLRELLDDEDALVRIAAYEALRRQRDPCLESRAVGQDNFVLDIVPSKGPGIVYARRTQQRRIALIGTALRCREPLLYAYPERPVTISARAGDNRIALVRKVGGGRRVWDPIQVSFAVADLVRALGSDPTEGPDGQPEGLGIDYTVVLDVLAELCRDKSIPAEFRLEQPTVADLLGPAEPVTRPESDEL